jgi:peptidylprolyl isomerase
MEDKDKLEEEAPAKDKDLKKSKKPLILILSLALLLIIGIGYISMTGNFTEGNKDKPVRVLLETNRGNITIELYEDMPITAGNFEKLVQDGVYDGVVFHRVIANFMIQGGDPTGTGMGDPSIPEIEDEFVEGRSNLRGTLAMANRGPNTGSSQFFINLVDNTYLDWDKPPATSKHPVFGEVVEGMDIVDNIGKVKTGPGDKPIEEVKIIRASII